MHLVDVPAHVSKSHRLVVATAAAAAGICFVAVLLVISQSHGLVGFTVEQEKDVLSLTLDSYSRLIDLVTAAFGAVAFLMTYQSKRGALTHPRAWACLAAGLVFLLGALIQGLIGRELLLRMIGENLVYLDMAGLRLGRALMYAQTVMGSGFIGWFALDVALSESRAPREGRSE